MNEINLTIIIWVVIDDSLVIYDVCWLINVDGAIDVGYVS